MDRPVYDPDLAGNKLKEPAWEEAEEPEQLKLFNNLLQEKENYR